MRNTLAFALATTALVGCAPETVGLSFQSTLNNETRGLVLHDEGDLGHAAMWDTTCEFSTGEAEVTSDLDLPTQFEAILDTRDGVVLAKSAEGLHFIEGGVWAAELDIAVPGVIDGKITDDGVAALVDDAGCRVTWFHDEVASHELDVSACATATDFAVLPGAGLRAAVLATAEGVFVVTPSRAELLAESGHTLSWNEITHTVLVGDEAGVSSITPEGDVQWQRNLAADVVDVSGMGVRGSAAVVTSEGFTVLSGDDGSTLAVEGLPSEAEVVVSRDANRLAFVTGEQAHFYDLEDVTGLTFVVGRPPRVDWTQFMD